MRCALCGLTGTHEDEVSGTRFCPLHAGPLCWNDHDVDAYSMALRIGGYLDRPVALPGMGRAA